MNEPRTSVTINDFTASFGVDPVDSRLNILCPIISPAGPTELTRVTGPSMLKRLYFGGRSITTSDNYSAVFARAVSANAPIYIKRGTRDNLRGGKSSLQGAEIFTDSSLNPIEGIKARFTQNAVSPSYSDKLAALPGVVTDYSAYQGSDFEDNEILFKDTKSQVEVKTSLKITSTTEVVNVTIGSNTYEIAANSDDFDDILSELAESGYCPQVIKVGETSQKARYRDGSWSTSAVGVNEIQWISNIAINIVASGDNPGVTVSHEDLGNIYTAKVKSESEFNRTMSIKNVAINVTVEDNVYSFYTDNAEVTGDVKISLGTNLSFYELMQAFTKAVAQTFNGDSSIGNVFIIPGASEITVSDTNSLLAVTYDEVNTAQYQDKFAVLSAFPCEQSDISVSISKNTEFESADVYTVTASYSNGDISETWDIAFDSGLVDGYGESLYYQRVNEESQIIRIVELSGENVQNQAFNIGSEVSSEYCGIEEIIGAYESIVEKEEADVMFDYITDGGLPDGSLSKFIVQMCSKYHSFYPASVPVDKTLTQSNLVSRRDQIGDFAFANCIGATQRGAFLDSGSAVYPASYYYLSRRITIGNSSSEFMPIFAQSNGDIGMQRPLQKFTATVREKLLDSQVPTLKREATGLYCINLNLTCKKQKSYMQEDGIVLMINKINQIADTYAKSIISAPNTDRTRATIESSLTQAINGRLRVGTDYGPQSIRVQCDRTNNPQSLIDQWKVRIDIYATFANSIRDVLIYTNVLPLQQ